MTSSLPIGWESRSNSMSEKDMKLGGIAATKFIDKSLSNSSGSIADSGTTKSNAYSGANVGIYQNSDQVREHYLRQIEQQQQQQQQQQQNQQQDDSPFSSGDRHGNHQRAATTPMFWEERQQMRQLEAEGFRSKDAQKSSGGVSSANFPTVAAATPQEASSSTIRTSSTKTTSTSAHVALVKVATNTLESLADVLEDDETGVEIPLRDRAAFAKAIQRAMQALAAAKK